MRKFHKNAAFTLIEMAIVVAIIGLIAGAIMAGQTYVRNSKLNIVIKEEHYYRFAFHAFEKKYGVLPGDMPSATDYWAGVGSGNGNGTIDSASNYCEVWLVFTHLSKAGMITGNYPQSASTGCGYLFKAGLGIPRSPINNVGYYFLDVPNGYSNAGTYYYDGFYPSMMTIAADTSGDLPRSNWLTAKEMFALDSKWDDGKPGTGTVRAPLSSYVATCSTGTVTAPDAAVYNVSNTTVGCRMYTTDR